MSDSAPKAAKPPRPVTPEWLFRAAGHYLERYASTEANLRRVLQRKVMRRAQARGEEPSVFEPMVDETVARFVELKLLDDRSYAEAKLASLRRRGTSLRQSAAKLAIKGVDRETVASVMAGDETDDADAARRLAQRRRLGPHRLRERAERRDRDVAALMRAGFSYSHAAAAIDGEADNHD
ncbi:regulatory protein RecX [Aureimonas phyllosphaerae]|uniref:Regulatory protein n=1 Tax=Aureimonas phyllosphaerae TaxID=1166078 RepID=A0A7W6BRP5_9HYPH|nr:RecX family transcriptional regulator [Aureimonas phyllosphaerae]MBB3935647.1 regulatory protein [Aureimonas phyllosphaerae]MBB3959655.1 regulatory protein [Aureimonas phyllosphaerae]